MRLPNAKLNSNISNTVPMGNKAAAIGVDANTPEVPQCLHGYPATKKMLQATKYHGAEGFPFRQLTMDSTNIAGAESAPRFTRL